MAMERQAGLRKTILAVVDLSQYSLSWDLVFTGIVTLVVIAVTYGSWRKRIANVPPGPRNWPVIGALFDMEPQLHIALDKFSKKYGHVILFRLGVQTLVVVSSSEVAEELLKHKDVEFCDRAIAMTKSVAKYTGFDGALFPFADYDIELKLHRKISNMKFFTTVKMKSCEELRTQEMAMMVEKIFHAIQITNDKKDDYNSSRSIAPMGIPKLT